jgi:hypothetical protein
MSGSEPEHSKSATVLTDATSRARTEFSIEADEKLVTESTAGGRLQPVRDRGPFRGGRDQPLAKPSQVYADFRKRVDELYQCLGSLAEKEGETFEDDWAGAAAQVDVELDRLYDVNWGEKGALKKVVAVLIGIVRNAEWEPAHAKYLLAVAQELRVCWLVDHQLAVKVSEMAEAFGLDPFRGTVSKPKGHKRYKLVEIQE